MSTCDIRSIILCKADYHQGALAFLRQGQGIAFDGGDGGPYARYRVSDVHTYAALGDYDSIYTSRLEPPDNSRLLETVNKEKVRMACTLRGTKYYHPLFMLRYTQGEAEEAEVRAFWEAQKGFFFVTSVFLGEASARQELLRSRAFEQKLKELGDEDDKDTLLLVYETLQISRYIVVWKSDSYNQVMRRLEKLYKLPGVLTYTRSVCALPWEQEHERLYQKGLELTERTELLEVRVVARSYPALLALKESPPFKTLAEDPEKHQNPGFNVGYFIAGDSDYEYLRQNISAKTIYEWIGALIETLKDPASQLAEAAEDIQTHLGIPAAEDKLPPPPAPPSLSPKTMALCERFTKALDEFKTQDKYALFRQQPWFHEFTEQGQQLLFMANSCVLENVYHLTFNSALFFCDWLGEAAKLPEAAQRRKLMESRSEINKYLGSLARLSGHAMRSDAIATHRPVCPPPSDNICTGTIEFCAALFSRVSEYFQHLDCTQEGYVRHCSVLLVPKLCRRIKIFELFRDRYRDDLRKPEDTLLLLEVPLENVSNPNYVLAVLVHEAAHYFGNRLRPQRALAIFRSLSLYLRLQFGLEEPASLAYIEEELIRQVRLKRQGENDYGLMFWDLLQSLSQAGVTQLLRQPAFARTLAQREQPAWWRGNVRRDLVNRIGRESIKILVPGADKDELQACMQFSALQLLLQQLGYFTKECYADLMLVYALHLPPEQYLQLFTSHELRFLRMEPPLAQRRLWQRFFMVFEAIQCLQGQGAGEWLKPWLPKNLTPEKLLPGLDARDEYRKILDGGLEFVRTLAKDYTPYRNLPEGEYRIPAGGVIEREGVLPYCVHQQIIAYLSACLKEAHRMNTAVPGEQDLLYDIYRHVVGHGRIMDDKFFDFLHIQRDQTYQSSLRKQTSPL